MTQNEIWKSVVGYEGYYEVSNLGRVKSIARNIVYKKGKPHPKKERIMHPVHRKDGYMDLCLYKDTINQRFMVHYLVARAFLGEPKDKKEVNHKNGIREDNRAENLEWVTRAENIQHKFRTLGYKNKYIGCIGKENIRSKPLYQIKDGIIINEFPCASEAEKATGVSKYLIWSNCKGRCKTGKGFNWVYKEKYNAETI
jgi:hypothetical protein